MWVKIQHQIKVLNRINSLPNMTALTIITTGIINLHCLMKHHGVIGYFHLQNKTMIKGFNT